MHRRTSFLTLSALLGLSIIAIACGVQAAQPSGVSDVSGVEVTATAERSQPDSGSVNPTATETTDSSGPHQPTSSEPPAPSPGSDRSGTVQPTPTAVIVIAPTRRITSTSSCGSVPVLTHSPMAEGTFNSITPLGNLAPPGHTFPTGHMYFALPFVETGLNDGPFGNGMVFPPQAVYAVAGAQIASLAMADVVSTMDASTESYQEFDLHLEVCDGLWIRYGHIGPLTERLQALVDQAEPDRCNSYTTGSFTVDRCEYSPGWPVEAGELIAYTSGRAAAFDLGASRPGKSGDQLRVPECPLDLYDSELRTQFEQLLGDGRAFRTVAPVCGTVDQDIPGTAQGRWFLTLGGHPIEDQNLALVHDNIDPSVPVFSVGNTLPGVQSNAYRYVPASAGKVNREFSSVTPGSGVFCYEGLSDRWGTGLAGVTLLLEMPDETSLRIEAVQRSSCGAGPRELSTGAVTHLR